MSSVSMVDGHIDPDTGITIPEMTPQEALELLNNVEFAEQYQGKDEYGTMLLMCKDALLKQMPKKATPHIVHTERLKIGNARWGKGTTVYKCPCCNNFISRLYDFCFKCGQALDWSDTE